jgi:hypothetical protein
MSSLLNGPEAEKLKCEGGLVGDALVIEVLLETLLKPGIFHQYCLNTMKNLCNLALS